MPDPKIEDHSDEMEHDLHKLEDHIADAEKKLEERKEAAGVAGNWEGEQDRGGGDDPQGAKDDAEQAAPGGSQDGPASDEPASGAGEGDERVDEEMANPT